MARFDRARTARWLDGVEQLVVLLLYAWLVQRVWPSSITAATWQPLLLLVSEGLVIAFLLLRRPTDRISTKFQDWVVAAAGTFFALLVVRTEVARFVNAGAALMLAGMLLQVSAKLCLRRSFGLVAANRGVKAQGVYGWVRHPMYAGYMITHVGFLLMYPVAWNLMMYGAVWLLLLLRIHAEERVLGTDPEYQALASRVRYRLVPGLI